MKKLSLIFAFLPLFINAQSRFGISLGGSYGKTASYSIGFTSQKVLSVIGFNAEYKGPTDYDWNKVKQPYYEMGKINYSILVGINANIKKFTISANGGGSFLKAPVYKSNWTGPKTRPDLKPCYEGLIGYNVIDKEKYILNLRAGYNNNYGGILTVGILF